MNTTLWIVAGLLAFGCLAGGAMKLVQPKEKLAASGWGWVEDFSGSTVKTIGLLEVLAAVGLILPAALDIAPVLVPVTVVGLAALMVGAFATHIRRREIPASTVPVVLFALSIFVAWGRFGPHSF